MKKNSKEASETLALFNFKASLGDVLEKRIVKRLSKRDIMNTLLLINDWTEEENLREATQKAVEVLVGKKLTGKAMVDFFEENPQDYLSIVIDLS